MNEANRIAYLIKATKQLEATEKALIQQLSGYSLQYRSSEYRKYQLRWRKRLMLKTGYIEEDI